MCEAVQRGLSRRLHEPDNLVVGPLPMIGAGRYTPPSVVQQFGGNKFPALVKAGHTVTVALSRPANRSASLFYAIGSGGALTQTRVRDGRRAISFRACRARKALSEADGESVTFWSGFVVVSKPMCVPLKIWIDAPQTAPLAHRARAPLLVQPYANRAAASIAVALRLAPLALRTGGAMPL